MSWNNIPNDERLRLWKNLRVDISKLPMQEQMQTIATFFAGMPFGARTLDYFEPTSWPTPWEILFHGSFCKSSISILIFYTFVLLPNPPKSVELHLIDDGNDEYLVPVIDNQFVLNYELGAVNNYPDVSTEFENKQIFLKDQIKKIA